MWIYIQLRAEAGRFGVFLAWNILLINQVLPSNDIYQMGFRARNLIIVSMRALNETKTTSKPSNRVPTDVCQDHINLFM